MKVTFMEEIEAKHAWRECMYCPKCDSGTYRIHHQLKPETSDCWWIACPECGHESSPAPTREFAIKRWQRENKTSVN